MSSLHLSRPETPLAISAYHEQEHLDSKCNKSKARHIHFTWSSRSADGLNFQPYSLSGTYSQLPDVKIRTSRFSKEGVRYSQIYSLNPKEFIFDVEDGQFYGEFMQSRDETALVAIPGFEIRINYLDDFSDGSLIELSHTAGFPSWQIVQNEMGVVVACAGEVEFGKPTIPALQQTLDHTRTLTNSMRSVAGSMKRLGRKLTGKGKKGASSPLGEV